VAATTTSRAPYPSSGRPAPLVDSRWEVKLPNPNDASALPPALVDRFGVPLQRTDDPAYAPPYDPTKRGNLLARASVTSRQAPIVHVETGWSPDTLRQATVEHTHGMFEQSTQIVDTLVLTDSRVQSALSARSGGLLGRPLTFKLPKRFRKSALAKECLQVWRRHWPAMATEAFLSELLFFRILLGFGQAQMPWKLGKYALPFPEIWSSRYTYFDFEIRRYVNITMDGNEVVDPGDGHHLLYAPHGSYRGWMRGKAFAIINWWLSRQYALRDMSRYSERHGFPILLAETPMGADVDDINNFRDALTVLGQESVVQLPQSLDASIGKYGLTYLEAIAANYEVFGQLIDHCNAEITLAIMGQNLAGGSEVKEGSFAAARVHADVRQQILEQDAMSLSLFCYEQIARPFAALNFGNPDLAPRCFWNVEPVEDRDTSSKVAYTLAMALNALRMGGVRLKKPRMFFMSSGRRLGPIEHVDPTQVESKLAGAIGAADDSEGSDGSTS
jgi:hypothetical protein